MAKVKETPQIDGNKITKTVIGNIIDKNESVVWNRVKQIETRVSSGSLSLDSEITLTQGIHRFCGPAGAGKTSEAAEVARNFLATYEKSKVLWIKAEGRLSEMIQKRSGVKFVMDESEWNYGTAFVLECNVLETLCELIDSLVTAFQETGDRLLIVLDSVDGLRLKDSKELGKEKTAGPQLLFKRYLQKSYYPIVKSGTMIILISQVSATIAKDDYGPPALTSGGGGNALLHWANYILEFSGRYFGDNIYLLGKDGPKNDPVKNPIIGHSVRVTIKKSDKENELKRLEYPIRHGRENGNSIWIEQEVVKFAEGWDLIEVNGAWYSFPAPIIKDVKEKLNIELKPKIQGLNSMVEYLEQNPTLTKYLFDRLRTVLSK